MTGRRFYLVVTCDEDANYNTGEGEDFMADVAGFAESRLDSSGSPHGPNTGFGENPEVWAYDTFDGLVLDHACGDGPWAKESAELDNGGPDLANFGTAGRSDPADLGTNCGGNRTMEAMSTHDRVQSEVFRLNARIGETQSKIAQARTQLAGLEAQLVAELDARARWNNLLIVMDRTLKEGKEQA